METRNKLSQITKQKQINFFCYAILYNFQSFRENEYLATDECNDKTIASQGFLNEKKEEICLNERIKISKKFETV